MYWVSNSEADLMYLVSGVSSKRDAIRKVTEMIKTDTKLYSVKRLKALAQKKKCSPHVLLKADDLDEVKTNIYSLNE